jgi:hypothetical protein
MGHKYLPTSDENSSNRRSGEDEDRPGRDDPKSLYIMILLLAIHELKGNIRRFSVLLFVSSF